MQTFQRSFSVDAAVLVAGHPYAVDTSRNSCTIHFSEFRGRGPPSADFGRPGDVYIDVNPRLHSLYWRERDIVRGFGAGPWKRWTALLLDKVPLHKFLVAHPWAASPEASDLYLWVDPGGVVWTSKNALCASRVQMIQKNIAKVVPGTASNVDVLVSEVLQRMLERERSAPNTSRGGGVLAQTPHSQPRYPTSPRPLVEQTSSAGSSSQDFRLPPLRYQSPTPAPFQPQRDSFRPNLPPNEFGRGGSGGLGPPLNASPHHIPGATYSPPMRSMQDFNDQDRRRAERALEDMRRAQYAETKSKQELRQKNRELAQLRKKEKEVIGISYIYQKREQDLVAALAAAQQRSSAELEQMRAAVHTLNRQAEAAKEQTRIAVAQVQASEEELAVTQREIQNLHSHVAFTGRDTHGKSSRG